MNLLSLILKNIGPFKECEISLQKEGNDVGFNPEIPSGKHLIITGENGTGKSIIIDSIRSILYGEYASTLERNVIGNLRNFKIIAEFYAERPLVIDWSNLFNSGKTTNLHSFNMHLNEIDNRVLPFRFPTNFVLEYWNSKLSTDNFEINSLELLDEKKIFVNPLSGVHKNADIIKTIAFFDYLKDGSNNEKEAEVGQFLYDTTVRIINSCILEGKFVHVSRKKLTPLFLQFGNEITIDKLSSGSIYIMQRMLSLLSKAYAAFILNPKPISEILSVKGLLLIDEAETHLHPKWQKVLFKNILEIFPNLQIIAATHSPFIVSSLQYAEVVVCKAGKDGCYIETETETYANKPIEEILRTPLFDTDSFSTEISDLLIKRKKAIQEYDNKTQKVTEAILEELNPEYFKYLKIGYL